MVFVTKSTLLSKLAKNQYQMPKNSMYYDTHRTKICKDIYRPSSNIALFFKSLLSVILIGNSPISNNSFTKYK